MHLPNTNVVVYRYTVLLDFVQFSSTVCLRECVFVYYTRNSDHW